MHAFISKVLECILENSETDEIYIVGGVVRDVLLGSEKIAKDIDISLKFGALELAKKTASKFDASVKVYEKFGTSKVIFTSTVSFEVDFVNFRKETYSQSGVLPEVIKGEFRDDLLRRDFTINSLAIRLEDFLKASGDVSKLIKITVDLASGVEDLFNRLIKVHHKNSFVDDPSRIFRAFKYKNRIHGEICKSTNILLDNAIRDKCLSTISPQRILNELNLITSERRAAYILEDLFMREVFLSLGLLSKISNFTDFRKSYAQHFTQNESLSLTTLLEFLAIYSNETSFFENLPIKKKEIVRLKKILSLG